MPKIDSDRGEGRRTGQTKNFVSIMAGWLALNTLQAGNIQIRIYSFFSVDLTPPLRARGLGQEEHL